MICASSCSDDVLDDTLEIVHENLGTLYRCAEAIAIIDMLVS